jgi:hypothetical protein
MKFANKKIVLTTVFFTLFLLLVANPSLLYAFAFESCLIEAEVLEVLDSNKRQNDTDRRFRVKIKILKTEQIKGGDKKGSCRYKPQEVKTISLALLPNDEEFVLVKGVKLELKHEYYAGVGPGGFVEYSEWKFLKNLTRPSTEPAANIPPAD